MPVAFIRIDEGFISDIRVSDLVNVTTKNLPGSISKKLKDIAPPVTLDLQSDFGQDLIREFLDGREFMEDIEPLNLVDLY